MNNYGHSVQNYHHLHENIRTEKAQGEKNQQEIDLGLPAGKFNLLILSYLTAETLLESIRSTESLKTPQKVIDSLKEFLAIFKQLEATDLSADWRFSEKLSRAWLKIKLSIEESSFPTGTLNEMIEAFDHFPEKGDHSLGYYLSLHAGEQWIPFPFMEILRNLHENKNEIQKLVRQGELALRALS
ncbi:MAG: hypothetical protein KGQ54_00140 [Verrucomicrobia bacterium]|nr:hypothetical protein [Verrucomicrobiota bacterium]